MIADAAVRMPELTSSIGTAFKILKSLNDLNEKIKSAELKGLTGDLGVELAEAKMRLAEVLNENTQLKSNARALESPSFAPGPKCGRKSWKVVATRPDNDFGAMGVSVRSYKCSECGLSEPSSTHNSAVGYVTPRDMLAGRRGEIHAERDRKLEKARKQRQIHRQQVA